MFDLTGMTALVTGASGGLGTAIAKGLAAQGARLAISGSNAEKLEAFRAELGGDTIALQCDLSNAEQVDQLGHRKIEKSTLAIRFKVGCASPAKINLDLWTAEWPQMIGRRGCSIGRAEEPAVFLEFFGLLKRQKKLVGKAERQIACGHHLVGKRGHEKAVGVCKNR